jgi:hypothetical protein
MDQHKIRQMIDACRPGSDDVHAPDFAAVAELIERDARSRRLYDRTQRLDIAIGAAFQDVEVPEGLAQRLLAAAVAAQRQSAEPIADDPLPIEPSSSELPASAAFDTERLSAAPDSTSPAETIVSPASQSKSRKRFGWKSIAAGAGTLAAVAALALVAVFFLPRSPSEVSQDEIAKLAAEWTDAALLNQWNQNPAAAPAQKYPVDSSLRASVQSWQRLRTRYDSQAVVYSLAPIGQPYVLQVTVRTNEKFAVLASPPSRPFSTTGGLSIGAWQRDGVLYVLIVQGDERRYQSLLKPPPSLAAKPAGVSPVLLTGKV